jgi:hypothetical protein
MFYRAAWFSNNFSSGSVQVIIPPSLLLRNEYLSMLGDIGISLPIQYFNRSMNTWSTVPLALPVRPNVPNSNPIPDFSYRTKDSRMVLVKGRSEFSDRILNVNTASCQVNKAEMVSTSLISNPVASSGLINSKAVFMENRPLSVFVSKNTSNDYTAYPKFIAEDKNSFRVTNKIVFGVSDLMVVRSRLLNNYTLYRSKPISLSVYSGEHKASDAIVEKPSLIFSL